jgi:hypothetical protein
MKLVLVSRLGNAADALEAHLDFHLAAGVDVVVVESDSVVTIADRFARDGAVDVVRGAAVATASAAGADWLIKGDVNEFWWPRGGTLKELLEAVAPRYGSVQALPRHFVPVTDMTEPFSERMIHRLVHGNARRRFVRRAAEDEGRLDPVRGWFPIEVLRFPVNGPGGVYDDDALRRGIEEGVLTVDTRIRDVLRALADGCSPEFVRTDVVEEARFAADLATLGEADIVQACDRMDELEARLAALESSFTEAAKRRLRKLRRR